MPPHGERKGSPLRERAMRATAAALLLAAFCFAFAGVVFGSAGLAVRALDRLF